MKQGSKDDDGACEVAELSVVQSSAFPSNQKSTKLIVPCVRSTIVGRFERKLALDEDEVSSHAKVDGSGPFVGRAAGAQCSVRNVGSERRLAACIG